MVFSRGDAGGGTPSEGVWGTAPSWRGRGRTLHQILNPSCHKPDRRDRIELAPNAPALGRNAAVVPSSSCKTIPRAGSIGSTASPNASPSKPTSSTAPPAGEQRRQALPGHRIGQGVYPAHVVIHCSRSCGRRGG